MHIVLRCKLKLASVASMRNNPNESNPDSIDLYSTINLRSLSNIHPSLQLRFCRSIQGSSYNSTITTIALSTALSMEYPKVNLTYNFEVMQDLYIELLSPNGNVVIGSGKTNLVYVSRQKPQGMQLPLVNIEGEQVAILKLKSDNANEIHELRDEYTFTVTWKKEGSLIETLFGCCESMYCLRIIKFKFQQEYLVYHSDLVSNTNGQIKFDFMFNFRDLCFGRMETKIMLQLQKVTKQSIQKVAETSMTVKQLMQNSQVSQDIHRSRSGRLVKDNVGLQMSMNLTIDFQMKTAYKFIDYVRSKMQFFLTIGIDFTYSNIYPNDPKSLHYIPANGRSLYQRASSGIINILMQYDNDKLVPTYGFGAIPRMPNYPYQNNVSHCFPINGNELDPNLLNTEGVMEGIKKVLPHLQFSAPTVYEGVIKKAVEEAERMKRMMKGYVVLLLMTDGLNKDMDQIRDLIVKASYLPLSIIIVAIGNNQQAKLLKALQDKSTLTSYDSMRPKRSIVQFIQFTEVDENDIRLAEKTMTVVKEQIEEYHLLFGLTPRSYDVFSSKAINVKF